LLDPSLSASFFLAKLDEAAELLDSSLSTSFFLAKLDEAAELLDSLLSATSKPSHHCQLDMHSCQHLCNKSPDSIPAS
jgi:hypothetical protein